jgi:hypothetical protein
MSGREVMSLIENDLPLGALAYRKYEVVTMPDGSTARIAITLGDMDADTHPRLWLARRA